MVNGRRPCNPSHLFLKEFNLLTLSMNGGVGAVFTIMVACLALEAIEKD